MGATACWEGNGAVVVVVLLRLGSWVCMWVMPRWWWPSAFAEHLVILS